jgi:hypothetical protein
MESTMMLHQIRIALAATLLALAAVVTPVAAGFQTSGSSGSDLPMESLSLNFAPLP